MSTTAVAKAEAPAAQQVVAALLASKKYEVPEIAEMVGLAPSVIYQWQESELFQALVAGYKKRFTAEEFDELKSLLRRDGPTNFEFLRAVRDGEILDVDAKLLTLRLRASEVLFDKQVAKDRNVDVRPPIVVNIDARTLERLKTVEVEDAQTPRIDVEVDPD